MVPRLSTQCQSAAFAQVAAATDLRRPLLRNPRSTRNLAHRTALIPSSPASGIMLRIIEANLPRQISA